MGRRWAVGLIHYPVVDKNGRRIAAALTPTDLHDLARSARTYGVERLWVVTPLKDQQALAGRMLGFWRQGTGAGYNPNRGQALELVRLADDLEGAVAGQTADWGVEPLVWATSAAGPEDGPTRLGFDRARQYLDQDRPVLILFGTAWGLAPSVIERCDHILAPLTGPGDYNHLSVRSAAAIVLDRLAGR
jgi:hypothetical protein